ncbi:MAG: YncE family protein, partial [Pseudonocardiales bacterium]
RFMLRTMRGVPRAALAGAVSVVLLVGCAGEAGQQSLAATPTITAPSTALSPPKPLVGPRVLTVSSVPDGARVEVMGADGAMVAGTTPYRATVAGGQVAVMISQPGFNDVRQTVQLTEDRDMTVWLDRQGQLLTSLVRWDTGANPKQVAFTPDGREVWTSLLGGRGVQVYDATTGHQLHEVELGQHGAVEVIFTRDGRTAYASQMETGSVYEIDTTAGTVRRQIDGGGTWSKVMALSPDERTLYLANWSSDNVSEIDLVSGQVRRLIPTVRTPRGLFVTPDGGKLYVAGYENGEIQVIDLRSGQDRVLIRTNGAMRHLVGDATAMRLYASDMGTAQVYVVDLRTDTVQQLADVDSNPNTIDLSPDGRVLYVSCRGRNGPNYYLPGPEWGSVVLVDTATGRLLDAIVGGNQTTGLDVSNNGTQLAFSDFLDNRISVYAIPSYQALVDGDSGRVAVHKAELTKGDN